MLCEKPDFIVSTPTGLLMHIQQKTLVLKLSIDTLVVDKDALVLSFGYSSEDLSGIFTVGHTVYRT
jgi:ATP-dependent RNA helicase DDX56/DBP9